MVLLPLSGSYLFTRKAKEIILKKNGLIINTVSYNENNDRKELISIIQWSIFLKRDNLVDRLIKERFLTRQTPTSRSLHYYSEFIFVKK